MLARYLRGMIVLLLAVTTLVSLGLGMWAPWLAAVPGLLLLSCPCSVLAVQCVAAAYCNRRDPAPPASLPQLFKAWLREIGAASKVFLWWQPFRSNRFSDQLPASTPAGRQRGIVFVHGFLCNRGVWNAWYPRLQREGIPFEALNLEPPFASIDAYACLLDAAVTRMRADTGMHPLLVCHSMGGLAARAWMRAKGPDAQVHRIVTIGSPHRGTQLGHWTPQRPAIANAHQMRLDSEWLRALVSVEAAELRRKFVCFYSNCDNIVFPATSATLPDADNRHIPGVPHLALALDGRVVGQVLALL